MIRKITRILLTLLMICSLVVPVQASSIKDAQQKDKDLKQQQANVQDEKDALVQKLDNLLLTMEETVSIINAKQEEIAEKEDELIQAQINENNQYENMKKRIQYMYENGNRNFFEILFESKSLADFLSKAEYIATISRCDRDMLKEYEEACESIANQKEELEIEKIKLEELQGKLKQQQNELSILIAEKNDQIEGFEEQIKMNAEKLKQLQKEAEEQERLRLEAEKQAALDKENQSNQNNNSNINSNHTSQNKPNNNTNTNNKKLSNPCPSAYISSEFGPRESPGGIGSTNHKGRDYAAPIGTPIQAAASGVVTTVSYNVARGNYIVINHGGIATLYQHCNEIYVCVGQSVAAGDKIASVGNTGYSTGPHLHFEVHVDGSPVDPRLYL